MGHASIGNICEIFLKTLYARGTVSVREIVDICVERGESVHAGEGNLTDRPMLSHVVEVIVEGYLKPHRPGRRARATPVLVPVDMTPEQTEIYNAWVEEDESVFGWDCGDNGDGGEYGILDSIKWRFSPGWRQHYGKIPLVDYVTN